MYHTHTLSVHQDDKKLLVWDYNTPVPIKYISEPHMHSIPYIASSPDGEEVVGVGVCRHVAV
jgi:pre-mRNA-processing factor 17